MIIKNTSKYRFVSTIKWKSVLYLLLFLMNVQLHHAQDLFVEAGLGMGRVTDKKHAFGKGELHVNAMKSFRFGELGLDVSFGGNFIPNNATLTSDQMEIVSPNDSKFWAITALYRVPIKNRVFIEPRLGYSNLFFYVHTDDRTKIAQSNFTAGMGIGGSFNNVMITLRYQYIGRTPKYTGFRNSIKIISNSERLSLVLLRVSYRFTLNKVFRKH